MEVASRANGGWKRESKKNKEEVEEEGVPKMPKGGYHCDVCQRQYKGREKLRWVLLGLLSLVQGQREA